MEVHRYGETDAITVTEIQFQWCAKSIANATSQISTVNSQTRPPLHRRRLRMSNPQVEFSKRKTAKIGRAASAQIKGSAVVEFSPRSCGISQLSEARRTYTNAPPTLSTSIMRFVRCFNPILVSWMTDRTIAYA